MTNQAALKTCTGAGVVTRTSERSEPRSARPSTSLAAGHSPLALG